MYPTRDATGKLEIPEYTYNALNIPNPEFWFRYDALCVQYPSYSHDGTFHEGQFQIILNKYAIRRKTPKSVVIDDPINYKKGERLIHINWHKRYACPTLEEARKSFLRRKKAQYEIHMRMASIAMASHNVFSAEFNDIPMPYSPTNNVKDVYGDFRAQLMLDDDIPY